MCVQVTNTANRFEISSLLENILLKQVRWCLTFVELYILNLDYIHAWGNKRKNKTQNTRTVPNSNEKIV